jgi:drug/metabolite transporter (DMT)-like permease
MQKQRTHAYVILLVVSMIWGIAAPIIKNTLTYLPPLTFLTYRFFLSSLVALIFFALNRDKLPKVGKQHNYSFAAGIGTVVIGLSILFFGFEYTSAVSGSLLTATGPIFAVIAGHFMLKEKITRNEVIGITLAMLGSLLIVFTTGGGKELGLFGLAMVGNLIILCSRISDAIGISFGKKAIEAGVSPSALTHHSFLMGFLIVGIFAIYSSGGIIPILQDIRSAPLEAHLGVLYMAFISGSLAYALMNKAISIVGVGESSIFNYLTVVWAVPLSIFWLNESISLMFMIGCGIIATGVIIAEYHKRKKKKNPIKKKQKRIK